MSSTETILFEDEHPDMNDPRGTCHRKVWTEIVDGERIVVASAMVTGPRGGVTVDTPSFTAEELDQIISAYSNVREADDEAERAERAAGWDRTP